jgi:hypothetical protein
MISRQRGRGRPRTKPFTVERVKYNMDLVEAVEKSSDFWNSVETWPPRIPRNLTPANSHKENDHETVVLTTYPSDTRRQLQPLDNSRCERDTNRTVLCRVKLDENTTNPDPPSLPMRVESGEMVTSSNQQSLFNNTCLYIPKNRQEWEDSISEMLALCTSAAWRRHQADGIANEFHPPLSREYIRDRIDIDDPLHGYQLRHSSEGWLQGFCLWTNFTVWNQEFTFDSAHPESGVTKTPPSHAVDRRNVLANELQALPRHGNLSDTGQIFNGCAEIALLGGLGCGELLLRMCIEDIRRREYKYIVLQATESSRSFYEQFGFVRVGAVCHYPAAEHGNVEHGGSMNASTTTTQNPRLLLQGYRHWTHTNESQISLDLHGGESYMMALKLPTPDRQIPFGNLVETMNAYQVNEKPTVRSRGTGPSPSPQKKASKRGYTWALTPPVPKLDLMMAEATAAGKSAAIATSTVVNPMDNLNEKRRSTRAKRPAELMTMDFEPTYKQRRTVFKGDDMGPTKMMTPKSIQNKTAITTNSVATNSITANISSRQVCGRPRIKPPAGTTIKVALVNKNARRLTEFAKVKQVPARDFLEHFMGRAIKYAKNLPVIPIDTSKLCKQKIPNGSCKEDVNFYNKIVRHNGKKRKSIQYYFVLDYGISSSKGQELILIPVEANGELKGKRLGRPRYKCVLQDSTANWVWGKSSDYVVVPATKVMKSAWIKEEAWDVQDTSDLTYSVP